MREYRGVAIAIVVVIVVFACLLGGLVIGLSWLGLTGYAVFEAFADGSDAPNAAGIIIGIVALVTWLVALLAVAIGYLGKAMESPKRRDRERETIGL